jgi:hypothetical protein
VVQNAGSVLLQVGEATLLPGDFNGDGAIDAADYVVWRNNDGTSNGYNTWRTNFGRTAGSGSGATGSASANAAVPEPNAAILCAICASLLLRRWTR